MPRRSSLSLSHTHRRALIAERAAMATTCDKQRAIITKQESASASERVGGGVFWTTIFFCSGWDRTLYVSFSRTKAKRRKTLTFFFSSSILKRVRKGGKLGGFSLQIEHLKSIAFIVLAHEHDTMVRALVPSETVCLQLRKKNCFPIHGCN